MPDLVAAPAAPHRAPAPVTTDSPLSGTDLRALRAAIGGRGARPGRPGYDDARGVHNSHYDRQPAVIVRPETAIDVSRAVTTARELGLEIAVKGGGHSVAGHSTTDGGLLIDLGAMRAIDIDPVRRIGSAQGGATAGEYTTAAGTHGFATPFGDTGSVGLGGLTLGGGIGWLARKHGMTIDSLVEVGPRDRRRPARDRRARPPTPTCSGRSAAAAATSASPPASATGCTRSTWSRAACSSCR